MNAVRVAVIAALLAPQGAYARSVAASGAAPAGAAGAVKIAPAGAATILIQAPSLPPAPVRLMPSALSAPAAPLAPAAALAPAPAAPAAIPAAEEVPALWAPAEGPLAPAAKDEAGAPSDPGARLFDGARAEALKAFVVTHGGPTVEISLQEASRRGGPARLLTAKNDPLGLTSKDVARVASLLGSKASALQHEELYVDWTPTSAGGAAAETEGRSPTDGIKNKLLWPWHEARFLARAFAASLVKPLPSEIVGGIATKSLPLVASIGVFWATAGVAHPVIFASLVALNLAQEVFHGVFLKSWNNFQDVLSRSRGFNYQMFFNLAYMQGAGALYRALSWGANPTGVIPPWSPLYWKDLFITSVAGTFFGTLGYNGLNALYAKGMISRRQHSGIQQLRDLLFLLAGPFFATGSMTVFWTLFAFQQSLDLAIALWAGSAKARSIVFVTSAAVADSAEFKAKYPAQGAKVAPPLKQAWDALAGNPLVRLLAWPARAAWKALKGAKGDSR